MNYVNSNKYMLQKNYANRLDRVVLGRQGVEEEATAAQDELAAEQDWDEDPPDDEQDEGKLEGRVLAEVVGTLVLVGPGCIRSYRQFRTNQHSRDSSSVHIY